jgi:hypothetical protein
MSHHQDSEAARQDPRLDISDAYVFKGNSGTVFVLNTNPVSANLGFHPEALYEFHIDTDGDAVQDLTLRFSFLPADADRQQSWALRQLTGADAADRNAGGTLVATGVTGDSITTWNGINVFAGLAGEPFFIEPTVITAVWTALAEGAKVDLGSFDPDDATNRFAGTNVTAIVIEVPVAVTGVGTIGFWGTTALDDHHGGWMQINRCAKPLVGPLFGLTEGGAVDSNATDPSQDADRYGDLVRRKVADLVAANGTHDDPEAYGATVRDALLPDVLSYEVGTDACFATHSHNGRGLTEPSPEAIFELLLNRPVPMGLTAADATGTLRSAFPYLSRPV